MHNGKEIRKLIKEAAVKPVKKNPYGKDVSTYGYRDDSPYRNSPELNIFTPDGIIDMSNTGIPLMANGRYLPPYSGQHQFDDKIVKEIPLDQLKKGGQHKLKRGKHSTDSRLAELRGPATNPTWENPNLEIGGWLDQYQKGGDSRRIPQQKWLSGQQLPTGQGVLTKANNWLDNVDEFRRGGQKKMPRDKTSKNIQSSINFLQTRNYMLFGPSGRNLYDPNAKSHKNWLDYYLKY